MRGLVCVIFLLYFLNAFSLGTALRCFACSSVVGHKNSCEVNVNNHTVATSFCGYGYNTCMSLVMGNTVTRACAMSNVCSTYYNSPGFVSCSTCVHDLCNYIRTSGTTSISITSTGTLALLYIFVKYL